MQEIFNFLSVERHANHSASQDSEKDSKTQEETLLLSLSEFYQSKSQNGLSGKTSPVFYPVEEDGIFLQSSERLLKSGTAFRGECWTHNFSECPKDAEESLLSDILETGDHLGGFFLSPKACQGILRRAEKREKDLPEALRMALISQSKGSINTNEAV